MITAIDIDIRRITVVTDAGIVSSAEIPICAAAHVISDSDVLLEVASPVFYHGDGKAAFTSTARWMVWNALAAGMLAELLWHKGCRVLVAPSSVWTMGYDEPTRHEFAGMKPVSFKTYKRKGKTVVSPIYSREDGNHDVRECKAMIWSYGVKPSLWQPLPFYLADL